MSQIQLSLKHGRTLEEARTQMASAVNQVKSSFSGLVQDVQWAGDGNAATLKGKGFTIDMRVDADTLHLTGDLAFLGALLKGPVVNGLKKIVEKTFQKRLPP
jgi:hypothetical protein